MSRLFKKFNSKKEGRGRMQFIEICKSFGFKGVDFNPHFEYDNIFVFMIKQESKSKRYGMELISIDIFVNEQDNTYTTEINLGSRILNAEEFNEFKTLINELEFKINNLMVELLK